MMVYNFSNISLCLIAIFCSILFFSCEKPDSTSIESGSTAPIYTEIGANTMSYKVNGKLVKAFDFIRNSAGVYGSINDFRSLGQKNTFIIRGNLIKPDYYEAIDLTIENFIDTGYYNTSTNVPKKLISKFMYSIGKDEFISDGYVTDAAHHGIVHITKFDTLNQIVSGRFEFTGFLFFWGEEKDTVRITDGMFDFRYSK